jgi:hypothetical protein
MTEAPIYHNMQRRMVTHNYALPGIYHITLHVAEGMSQPLGRPTHLGQVIAGFKKGCNRRYWDMTGEGIPTGEPLDTLNAPAAVPIAAAPVPGGLAAGNNEQQNNERI